ncbi:RNA polymerase sigma factor [Kineococcus arenarius]|uniref:RNA polymerase sigma factor n=1 Tax=unclassified Kineococcus TaxID=2621656 RepID=UPI003D7D5210
MRGRNRRGAQAGLASRRQPGSEPWAPAGAPPAAPDAGEAVGEAVGDVAEERARRWLQEVAQTNADDVLSYLERRTADAQDAADVLGETLLVAVRRVDQVPRQDEQARMWLFAVARNVLANHVRSHQRRDLLLHRLAQEVAAQQRLQPSGSEGAVEVVRAAVAALPPVQRELVMLVHWDGFSLTDAATVTGVSASTARSRYARARALLVARLQVAHEAQDDPDMARL